MKEIATILGVPVIPYTMDEAVAKLTQDTLQRKRNFVVTANAEIIMMAQKKRRRKANAVGPVCMWPAAATGIFRRKKNRKL